MIERLDHLVLTVRDIKVTVDFYQTNLGMQARKFTSGGVDRWALHYASGKINLHQAGAEFEPKSNVPTPGSADLCFITAKPVADVQSALRDAGIEIIEGPVRRTGARGSLFSIYLRDPDGNLIELANE